MEATQKVNLRDFPEPPKNAGKLVKKGAQAQPDTGRRPSKYRDIARTGRAFIVSYVVRIAIPKLAIARASPTANVAGIQQRARMKITRSDLKHRAADIDIACTGWVFIVSYCEVIAVPKSATTTISPTANVAGI